MKLKFNILLIGLFCSQLLWANITKSEYDALIDEINCRYGQFLIQDEKTKAYLSEYNTAISPCDFVQMIEFYKSKKPYLVRNGEIAYIIDDSKLNYIQNDNTPINPQQLYNNTVNLFNNDTLLQHLETLSNRSDYLGFETEIIALIKATILAKPEPQPETTPESPTVGTNTMNNIFTVLTNPTYWMWFIIGLIGLMILRFLWRFYKKYISSDLEKHAIHNPIKDLSDRERKLEKENNVLKEEVKDIKQTISKIEQKEEKMEQELTNIKTNKVIVPEEPEAKGVPAPEDKNLPQFVKDLKAESSDKEIFYFPPPSVSGSFYEFGRRNEFSEDHAMYRFELVSEKYQICQFFVINHPDVVTQGMIDFEKYLHPACESENDPFPNASKIITIRPGVAKRSTNHWRVEQKAIIKFA